MLPALGLPEWWENTTLHTCATRLEDDTALCLFPWCHPNTALHTYAAGYQSEGWHWYCCRHVVNLTEHHPLQVQTGSSGGYGCVCKSPQT